MRRQRRAAQAGESRAANEGGSTEGAWLAHMHWGTDGLLHKFALNVADGMRFLAARGIMHRDLKVRRARA